MIQNRPSQAGQLAARKTFFGGDIESDFRFAIAPVHTRFETVSWFVWDALTPDEDGRASIVAQESSRDEALAKIDDEFVEMFRELDQDAHAARCER